MFKNIDEWLEETIEKNKKTPNQQEFPGVFEEEEIEEETLFDEEEE